MKISKTNLLDLLLDYIDGKTEAVNRISEAYKTKNTIWSNDEWIYVKDVEASLKSMKKVHQQGEFEQFVNIRQLILDKKCQTDLIEDTWIKNRILECRESMHSLFPE
ncbi:hypothetical protein SAMN06297280_3534 [Arsukibacterium tuosuense]|uniref:Uncharacterized protein n=1 Tax=Arsukibacterium tuosuense TaxID=1323745 RepID=A0A285JFA2_9GAMM|nr:hypothetical protein [Arsukibacterium tuosuense]SNY58980.1 hypothetical protein SAMN06297280_3534 [Arsukibacterium tuosuense]